MTSLASVVADPPSQQRESPRAWLRRQFGLRGHLLPLGILAVAVILIWSWPVWPDPQHLRLSNPGDAESFAFYLSWNVHALLSGADPFYTPNLYAPDGLDLGNSISIPSVSVLVGPVSLLFGGTAAYNVAFLVSILMAGFSVYLIARELTGTIVGSVIAGGLTIVSPYFVAHGLGHLNLMWIFGFPLVAYLVTRYVKGTLRAVWVSVGTALILLFTGGASTELLVTETVFAALALLIAVIFATRRERQRLLRSLIWLAVGGVAAALMLIPIVAAALRSGIPETVFNPPILYSSDLVNLVIPTRFVALDWFGGIRDGMPLLSNDAERSAFLGIPLIILIVVHVFRARSRLGWGLFAFGAAAIVASFGPALTVAGRQPLPFGLPWAIAEHIPGIDHALPGRFSAFAFVAACIVVADAWRRKTMPRWIVACVAIVTAAFMIPSNEAFPLPAPESAFVADGDLAEITRPGENVLVLPPGQWGPGMTWMDEMDFAFTMPTGNGGGATPPPALSDPVGSALWTQDLDFDWASQLPTWLDRTEVGLVVVDKDQPEWRRVIESALGAPQAVEDGVRIWHRGPDGWSEDAHE